MVPVVIGAAALAVLATAAASGRPLPSWVPVLGVPGFPGAPVGVPGSSAAGSGPLVVIDPGHGTPDPGATQGSVTEAAANLAVSLTLAAQLRAAGFRTELTRTGAARPPGDTTTSYAARTAYRPGQLCLISVHHNSPAAPEVLKDSLVFRQQGRADSARLAAAVSREAGVRVLDTWQSNYPRLYIDNARAPAVLWEVASVSDYRDSAAWRASMCAPVVRAVKAWAATA